MNLEEILALIKSKFEKEEYKQTSYFIGQIIDRNLNSEDIKSRLKNIKILGILKQNSYKYKLFIYYKKHKDLIIIIALKNKQINLITIFLQNNERRTRK